MAPLASTRRDATDPAPLTRARTLWMLLLGTVYLVFGVTRAGHAISTGQRSFTKNLDITVGIVFCLLGLIYFYRILRPGQRSKPQPEIISILPKE